MSYARAPFLPWADGGKRSFACSVTTTANVRFRMRFGGGGVPLLWPSCARRLPLQPTHVSSTPGRKATMACANARLISLSSLASSPTVPIINEKIMIQCRQRNGKRDPDSAFAYMQTRTVVPHSACVPSLRCSFFSFSFLQRTSVRPRDAKKYRCCRQ